MNYNNPLGVEYRVVDHAVHEGEPVRVISGSRHYAARIEDLWDAITNPERLPRWFLPVSGDLKPGGHYQLEGNAGGTIERCESPDTLDVTWEFGGSESWLRLRLESKGEGTLLVLKQLIGKDEASEAHWKKYGPGATGVGWELGFLGLGLHLDSGGEAVDEAGFHGWLATQEGKTFLKAIADEWGRAHVGAGEVDEVAMTMAGRTAAFYCGEEH